MGKYKSMFRALSATYNYFDDGFILKLRDDIYKKSSEGSKTYVIEEFPENGMDTLIYSWLVMMCGDYGTSPKVGWIEDLPGAVKFLTEFMEGWKDGN